MPHKDPAVRAAYWAAHRKTPEYKAKFAAWRKTERGKESLKNLNLKRWYGIDIHKYKQMLAEQQGKCAICGIHESALKMSLCVDHDHDTGVVRGLLCHHCNHGIGKFKENEQILNAAVGYLKKHKRHRLKAA